jgi:hypothetical protein
MSNTDLVKNDNAMISVIEKVAFSPDADVSKLEKMLEMQERYEAKEARKSFFRSLSKFQMDMPPVIKAKQGHNYQYAPLCDITAIANPVLNTNGLAYRFEQVQTSDELTVTCIVSNFEGHEEKTSMSAPLDKSGSKNIVQAAGSTFQYLMRYTFIGALGITTADSDSDARVLSQTGDFITDEQLAELESLLDETSSNREKFLGVFGIKQLSDLPQTHYPRAKSAIISKRNKA